MNNSYIIFTNAERRYVFVMEKTKSVARTNDRNNYYKIINKTCYTANIVYLILCFWHTRSKSTNISSSNNCILRNSSDVSSLLEKSIKPLI